MSTPAASSVPQRILFFDGVCNICNGSVRFILKHERDNSLHFASIQSDYGQRWLAQQGFPTDAIDTMYYVDGDEVLTRSSAAVALTRRLRWPWRLLSVVWLVPKPLRDMGYRWLARNRYELLGKRDSCPVPGPSVRARFL